ncbi:MAG: glycosyltransferase family 4 protein [Candidatus Bathyarchaeota archaeon]|nr:glycosyltransferase family 4 protein [Candidatus Bathyarchaeota archaeon]
MLLITQYFPPDLGGVATRTNNLVKGLTLNGCKVTVIAAFPHYPHGKIPPSYRWAPIKVEWLGQTKIIRTLMPPVKSQGFFKRLFLMAFFAFSALFAFPFVGRTDVVFGTSWTPGLVYSKLKRVPLVLDVCDLTLEDMPKLKLANENSLMLKTAAKLYRFYYVQADALAPISPGYCPTITSKYCVEKSKVHVIEIGVDTSEFKKSGFSYAPHNSFTVIYAGVFGVGYDFEQIFQAAKILKEKQLDVKFILHGSGECLESLRNRIKELNLTNVDLSDKLLNSRREVANLLNTADALILPLRDYGNPYPGIPSKLYEYQAVGKPIICCAEGEPVNYINASKSGVVVKPGQPGELSKAILFLSQNPEVALSMGKAGRCFVENNSSLEKIGLKVMNSMKRYV